LKKEIFISSFFEIGFLIHPLLLLLKIEDLLDLLGQGDLRADLRVEAGDLRADLRVEVGHLRMELQVMVLKWACQPILSKQWSPWIS
jgi:hypothetical protein